MGPSDPAPIERSSLQSSLPTVPPLARRPREANRAAATITPFTGAMLRPPQAENVAYNVAHFLWFKPYVGHVSMRGLKEGVERRLRHTRGIGNGDEACGSAIRAEVIRDNVTLRAGFPRENSTRLRIAPLLTHCRTVHKQQWQRKKCTA